jgi:hypothetical protein
MWEELIAAHIEGIVPVFFSAHSDRPLKAAESLLF